MIFLIHLNTTEKQCILPIDYQYYIGAWIYKIIGEADPDFARFLHTEGYRNGNKSFKFFNYSPLFFNKYRIHKDRALIEALTGTATLKVSFFLNDAAEKFIIGLFNNQQVYLGDRFNGTNFKVAGIERLPDPFSHGNTTAGRPVTIGYHAKSPVVFSSKTENDKYARYLSPEDEGYAGWVRQHLFHKYQTVPGAAPLAENTETAFTLLSKPKSKLITIKPFTAQQTKVRGYLYKFSLTAPEEIHKLVLYSGFGEKNASGFGWVETG
ncbi:CRISPR-associated protein, Cas6 family [Mariniphaga anaerophila]|uniref:CRISPR-associated endoribonuclease n=1 Tax=Mariniphaga anaerophila TaxID=1484053 RepID=A0A1M4WRF6_9BACT|nr:CRISPR-associated endoribonuclease Cas6 [Mariniphaga anaerophila]SHE83815.1 CRISPR-associated protein, Cas6 family [Mariniphaga anaerophila]